MRRLPVIMCLALAVGTASCRDDDPDRPAPSSSRAAAPTADPGTTVGSTATATTIAPDPPDPTAATVALVEWATGLDSPVAFAPIPGRDEVLVAEQHQGVRVVAGDGTLGDLVLDLGGAISKGNEQGVLGIAVEPDGSLVYVHTTGTDNHSRVTEYTLTDGIPDPRSAREVLFVEQPFPNHNGGDLKFGPDGLLYVALGDGGAGGDPLGSGQDTNSLLGKILRIDPTASNDSEYSVPSDNPFVGNGAGEIWAYGLRNPWRFSFDRATGDLWIGDVGQNEYEEISFAPAGAGGRNYGWNEREGLHDYEGGSAPAGAIDPVVELTHGDGNCSITGGFVYRGTAIADLVGAYVFGDYCAGQLLALDLRDFDGGSAPMVDLQQNVSELTSFGEANNGEMYAIGRGGTIYQIVAA